MKKILVLSLAAVATSSFAGIWNEVGEATDLMPGQITVGLGSLDTISGNIGAADADLYCIMVHDWAAFSATTVGGATFDTQLFLFTQSGTGIAFNDDSTGTQSTLPVGNSLYAGRTNGERVLLAVAKWDHDPVNALGQEIFPDTFSGVWGPSNGGTLTAWNSSPTAGGAYRISLTGTEYCAVPEPGTIAALGLGAAVLLRRKAKKA